MSDILQQHEFIKKLNDDFDFYKNFEPMLSIQYCKFLKQDSVSIDIGGHSGFHAKKMLQIIKTGKVLFIEPLDFIVDKSFFSKNVDYFNCAISNYIGTSDFVFAKNTPEESGLRQKTYNFPDIVHPEKMTVAVNTIDNIMKNYSKCDYIKIDVEGAELLCLDGARNTIKKYKPIISVEYGFPGYSAYSLTKDSLWNMCVELDYDIYDLFLNKVETLDIWKNICDFSTWDFFLFPKR